MTEQATADLKDHTEAAVTLVHDLFSTMLSSESWLADAPPDTESRQPIVGAIYFAGPWTGAVLVELQPDLAYYITAQLMGVPTPDSVNSDVRDAIGEVTNMLGGNLKSILPAGTMMSMPSVVEGTNFAVNIIGANNTSRLNFGTPKGAFRLLMVEVQQA